MFSDVSWLNLQSVTAVLFPPQNFRLFYSDLRGGTFGFLEFLTSDPSSPSLWQEQETGLVVTWGGGVPVAWLRSTEHSSIYDTGQQGFI